MIFRAGLPWLKRAESQKELRMLREWTREQAVLVILNLACCFALSGCGENSIDGLLGGQLCCLEIVIWSRRSEGSRMDGKTSTATDRAEELSVSQLVELVCELKGTVVELRQSVAELMQTVRDQSVGRAPQGGTASMAVCRRHRMPRPQLAICHQAFALNRTRTMNHPVADI